MEAIPLLCLFAFAPYDQSLPAISLDDLHRFPCLKVVQRELDAATARRTYARQQYVIADALALPAETHHWYAIRCETLHAYDVWECMRIACDSAYSDVYRIGQLEELRRRIGSANFYAGQLPAPVDVMRPQRPPEVLPLP